MMVRRDLELSAPHQLRPPHQQPQCAARAAKKTRMLTRADLELERMVFAVGSPLRLHPSEPRTASVRHRSAHTRPHCS